MKREGFIYEKLVDMDLVYKAIDMATKKKRGRHDVEWVLEHQDHCAKMIYKMFADENVILNPLREFENYDPHSKKSRIIHRPDMFPNQIIEWCMILVLRPIIMKGMYQYTCSSIPGRGLYYAVKYVRKMIDTDGKNTKYYAQLDVSKFYDSVDQEILLGLFERRIKDPKMLELIDRLNKLMVDGLPIGNYSSQWFSNFYLQDLDHFIKEELRIVHYVRYVDDLVLFAETSTELHTAVRRIKLYLETYLGLTLKSNWKVAPLANGLDFLGYVFFSTHTKIRKRNFLAFTRQARTIVNRMNDGDPISRHEAASLLCRATLIRKSEYGHSTLEKYLPWMNELMLRAIVSKAAKKANKIKKEASK